MEAVAARTGAGAPSGPLCFLHVPKCGGTSVHLALLKALPDGAVSIKRMEGSSDANDAGLMREDLRRQIAWGEAEIAALRESRVVSGHFTMQTLERITVPYRIATVLREARARVLSLYGFWRFTPGLGEAFYPLDAFERARGSLDEFLAEPKLAWATDNAVCRALLAGDPRLPSIGFLDRAAVAEVAAAALERLDSLGFVGALELKDPLWDGLSRFFGVPLEPSQANVTAEVPAGGYNSGEPLCVTGRALELLEQRTAADAIVYESALTRAGLDSRAAGGLREGAFASQLVRLGEATGSSRERGRHQRWVHDLENSASWRVTAPLRSAKRAFTKRVAR